MKLRALAFIVTMLFSVVVTAEEGYKSWAAITLNNLPSISYNDREEAERLFSILESDTSKLDKSQREKLVLVRAYFYAIEENSDLRVQALDSYDWSTASVENQIFAYQQYSETHINTNQYKKALLDIDMALELLPKANHPFHKMIILQSMYTVYDTLYLYKEALDVADRIISIGIESDGVRIHCYGLADYVSTARKYEGLNETLEDVAETIDVCTESNDFLVVDLVKSVEISTLVREGMYSEAIEKGTELYANKNKGIGYQYLQVLEESIGDAYFFTSNYELSEEFYTKSYLRAVDHKLLRAVPMAAEKLAKVKMKLEKWDESSKYSLISINAHKEYEKDLFHKSTLFHLAKIKATDVENQLKILQARNDELLLENQLAAIRYDQMMLLLVWATVVCVVLILSVLYVQRQKSQIKISLDTDTLTGIMSRSSLIEESTKAVAKAAKHGRPLSLVVFDLDHFKKINDTFGHSVGDWVLRTVTRSVRTNIREGDFFGRLGGEEFVICLPETNLEQARQLAERCREGLGRIIAPVTTRKMDISASFGVATLAPGLQNLDSLMMAADRCLYESKHRGRNCVTTNSAKTNQAEYTPSGSLVSMQAERGQQHGFYTGLLSEPFTDNNGQ